MEKKDVHLHEKVGFVRLKNQSGSIVKLECFFKKEESNDPQRIGESDYYEVGQARELNVSELGLAEGVWVTAYANVKAGKDDQGTTWLQYEKGNKRKAEFIISGVINFTDVAFNGIIEPEE
ncbi:hypothetical protein [Parabacteroides sp. PF5-6]|uniref:hypothetical protein n=1 Tax=Parabacteroides sp. PF5-6 TaxID=1742403 RepID=UPI0024068FAD|nr:hypothetical protein [Parabacteroides sp. PF5-6]MDF9830353.1 hypothetical protein [Parabacteroides sp. PF5-6]